MRKYVLSSARLQTLADRIEKCYNIIDVGCDHGLLSKYILDNCLAEKVIASDLSKKSLDKARKLLQGTDVDFRLGDGLNVLHKCESVDAAVIAGMGGFEIIKIIKQSHFLPERLYLIPHRNATEVREFLRYNYVIMFDKTVKENRRFYDVIAARRGEFSEVDFVPEFGITDLRNPSNDFIERLEIEKEKLEHFLSKKDCAKKRKKIVKISEILNNEIGGLQNGFDKNT